MSRKDILFYGMALVLAVLVLKEFNLFRPTLALAQEGISIQAALGSGFTYQGRLTDAGDPVNATCDFQFSLFDAAGGGSQVGSTQTVTNVNVSGGLFTAQLNGGGQFGSTAFNGEARWLQIAARCPAGSGNFTTLSPRQPLTAAPYALFSPTSGSTQALNGYTVSNAAPASGQVLRWNGSQWSPQSLGMTVVYTGGVGSAPGTAPSSLDFLAPPAQVTVMNGQRVVVHSTKAMGSTMANGGLGLTTYICYRQVGGAIVSVGQSIFGVRVPTGTRVPISLSTVIEGLNGTYDVGLCGFSTQPTSWNDNAYGYTAALISN
ncbi:MAG: hypothetical protein KDI62_16005 [Anaerolineae bacterium]|nr:hypothetical protein [Anaerolineae bacterium]